ncbi:MAG: TonB-dependent receptor [Hyphomonadaceae bacterium]|nr:TonB-dependent receptor [Hyphomonadaceae bacterium]
MSRDDDRAARAGAGDDRTAMDTARRPARSAMRSTGIQSFARTATRFAAIMGASTAALGAVPALADDAGDEVVVTRERIVGNRLTAPLLDTPRTVVVIPQEVIRQSASATLAEALRTTPGITLGSGEGGNPIGDRPFIRGFDSMSDTFADGLRDNAAQSRDVFNLEEISLIKGPSSAYTGRGGTGGSIALTSKTANLSDDISATATLGDDATMRATGDVNVRLGETSGLRINVMGHDAEVAGRDAVTLSRWGAAASLALGLDTANRLTLNVYTFESDDIPDYGLPYSSSTGARTVANVDPDNFYGLVARDFRRTGYDSALLKLERDFANGLTLSNITRISEATQDYVVSNPDDSRGNVVNGFVLRNIKSRGSENESLINLTTLGGDVSSGGLDHVFVLGVEISREETMNRGYTVTGPGLTTGTIVTGSAVTARATSCSAAGGRLGAAFGYNCTTLNDPDPYDPWIGVIGRATSRTETATDTWAVFGFDTITFSERWEANIGVRYDSYSADFATITDAGAVTAFDNESDFVNYQVGLVYKPVRNASLYVSYGTSSNPSAEGSGESASGNLSAVNDDLEPEENRAYELGAKWAVLDGDLTLSAGVFRTEKTNARVANPTAGAELLLVGDQRVDGFEIGVTGAITDAWDIFAGYTYLDAIVEDDGPAAANDGKQFPNVAPHAFSVWTSYAVTPTVTLAGGAAYMDARFADAANLISIDDYWRFDAMARFALGEHLDLQINGQNLSDERYVTQPYTSHMAQIAPGRSVLATLIFQY